MIKKISALCLSIILIFSISASAAVEETVYTYDEAILKLADEMLSLTGVNDLLSIDEAVTITRADFIYAMGILLKWPAAVEETLPYKDVEPDAIYLPALSSGLKLGYLSPSDTFNGSDPIRLTDAVKLAVSGAGFSMLANAKGGYPAGYIACAHDAEILNYINTGSDTLTGADFKILMYNMMTCAYMYETGFGDSIGYENETGKTLLGDIHKLYIYEGLVTATPDSRLTSPSSVSEGKIEINGVEYNSEIDSSDLLGFNVIGFYTKSSAYTVLSAVKANNTVVQIDGTDFESYPPSSNRIGVWNGDKTKYYNLKTGYNFIYNGKSLPSHANAYYGNDFIDMTIVDNNDDGVFDVVFANEYTYYTLGEISDLQYQLVDTMSINGTISLHDPSVRIYATDENGIKCEWYNLKPSSVVAALISNDNKLIRLRTLTETVSGTVDQINSSDNSVVIGGKTYRASVYLNSVIGGIKLGVTYSLKADGDILVAPSSLIDTEMYGFIAKAGTTAGIEAAVRVQMLTDSGKLEILYLADNIKLNGTPYLKSDAAVSAVINTRQLVKYKLNSENKITLIRTATPSGQTPFDNKSDEYTEFRKFDRKYTTDDTPKVIDPLYKSGTATFLPYCCVKNTMFFVVPSDVNKEELYDVGSYSSLGFINKEKYSTVEFYDISSEGMCTAAVYEIDDSLSTLREESDIGLIEDIVTAINDNGDVVSRLYLLTENGYTSHLTDTDTNVSGYSKGDVIRYAVDAKGIIVDTALDFDLDNSNNHYSVFNNWTSNSELSYLLSKIYSYEGGYAYLVPVSAVVPNSSTRLDFSWNALKYTRLQGTVVVYNMTTGKARYGTAADFKSYKQSGVSSYVLAKTNKYLDGEFIIIYEE